MRITCNADLFRIAYMTVSTQESRYYLNGVFIEPAPMGGVFLVSTDSHRMTVIHDAGGRADRPAIIQLSKDALKAFKPARNEKRRLAVDIGERSETPAVATVLKAFHTAATDEDFAPVAVHHGAEVDGTFPDYRRVIPTLATGIAPSTPAYDGRYLADFAKMGAELSGEKDARMIVHSFDASGPGLVQWMGVGHAFGVIMPVRHSVAADRVPAWFTCQNSFQEQEAAE